MTTDSGATRLKELASRLDRRVDDLGDKARRSGTPAQLLAATALSLLEELEELRAEQEAWRAKADEALTESIARLDAKLADDFRSRPPSAS